MPSGRTAGRPARSTWRSSKTPCASWESHWASLAMGSPCVVGTARRKTPRTGLPSWAWFCAWPAPAGKIGSNCSLLMSLGYLFVRIPRCSQTQQKIVNTFSAIPVSRPPNRVPVMPYTVKTNTTMLAYPWRVLPYLFVRNLGTIIRYG